MAASQVAQLGLAGNAVDGQVAEDATQQLVPSQVHPGIQQQTFNSKELHDNLVKAHKEGDMQRASEIVAVLREGLFPELSVVPPTQVPTQAHPDIQEQAVTLKEMHDNLAAAHEAGDMQRVNEIIAVLRDRLIPALSMDPASEAYLYKWFALAEKLRLRELRNICLDGITDPLVHARVMRDARGVLDKKMIIQHIHYTTWFHTDVYHPY